MTKLNCLIIEPSYLIRKGLVSLFKEFKQVGLVLDSDSVAVALQQLEDQHFQVLVTTDDLIEQFNTQDFALVYQIKHDKKSKGKQILNILHTKEDLVRQLLTDFKAFEGLYDTDNALTEREIDVLKLVAEGKTNKEVAKDLFISMHTVIAHRKNITKKLGIKTVQGLTIYAMTHNIIELKSVINQSSI